MMLVGLQGSGKTTTTAKLAKYLEKNKKKKIMMVSLDVYRPAAQEQLRSLGRAKRYFNTTYYSRTITRRYLQKSS